MRPEGRRIVAGLMAGFALAALLAVLVLFVVSRTERGRTRIREIVIERIERTVHGRITIGRLDIGALGQVPPLGRLEGSPITRVTLIDVVLHDEEGRPFVDADTISFRLSLTSLLRQRIVLRDVRVVGAHVILDEPPGEDWNFARILRFDRGPGEEPGWGDWIVLEDVEVVDSRVTVRAEWAPSPELSPAERDAKIGAVLAGEGRSNVQPVPGGFQNVFDFRALHGFFPRIVAADPEPGRTFVRIERLRMEAQPFRPPAVEVRDLAGVVRFSSDSIRFENMDVRLSGSEVEAEGVYLTGEDDLRLELRGDPIALADLRWLYPRLPSEGGGPAVATVRRLGATTSFLVSDMDVRVGGARITGQLGMAVGDTLLFRDTDLGLTNVPTAVVEQVAPGVTFPRPGALTGRLALDGPPEMLALDGDLIFADAAGGGRSRIVGAGLLGAGGDGLRFEGLALEFLPIQASLAREFVPQLPPRGTVTGRLRLTGSSDGLLALDGDLTIHDPRTGNSRLLPVGRIDLSGPLAFRRLRVTLRPMTMALAHEYVQRLPTRGTITGELTLDGPAGDVMQVRGALVLRDPATGESRVSGSGGLRVVGSLLFQDLALGFDPLQVDLAERLIGETPLAGIVTGDVTLNGREGGPINVAGDIVHLEEGERSRVAGSADILPGDRASVNVELLPLSLVAAGRFAPAAGLRGVATGRLSAEGSLGDLAVRADLRIQGDGRLLTSGSVDLASDQPGYDLFTTVAGFDVAAVTSRAPATTSLSGDILTVGRGLDPATMRARIEADLVGPRVQTVEADTVVLRLTIAGGLALVDSVYATLGASEARAQGSFGLVAGRFGELAYSVVIDSIQPLAPYLPPADTGLVAPRPVVLEAARARAEREAMAREVELLATGRAPAPPPRPIELAGIRRDSLAGGLVATGVLRGNVDIFDLVGRAEIQDLVVRGNYIGTGWIEHEVLAWGSPLAVIDIRSELDSVLVNGFAFDSITTAIRHRAGADDGRAVVAAFQPNAEYFLDADFSIDLGRANPLDSGTLFIRDLTLRADTLVWQSVRTGLVRWDDQGVELETIELFSEDGGRIFAHGRIPYRGDADLVIVGEAVQLEHIAVLLQDDFEMTGEIWLDAAVRGTLRNPRITGRAELRGAEHAGRRIPLTRATFAYAGLEMNVDGDFVGNGIVLATARARIPMDLSLVGRSGPLLRDGPFELDLDADSLPLEGVGALTPYLENVQGRLVGDVSVRGTTRDPVLAGEADVQLATLGVVPLGVVFRDVTGLFRFQGQSLIVDSLVATSRGTVHVGGSLDLSNLLEPGFDLDVVVEDAVVMDNEDGEVRMDADLEIVGPFDGVVITGEVQTRRSVIYVPERRGQNVVDLDDPGLPVLDTALLAQVEPEPSPLIANLLVDVDLFVTETWVRSTNTNIELETADEVGPLHVQLDQAAGRLTLTGTVNSDRGDYSFLGRRFRITRGAATFVGESPIDPLIQIAAEHEVRIPGRPELQIRIVVSGTARYPTITLESSAQPPIPETDLLSYLAFGQPASTLLPQQGSALSGQSTPSGDLVGSVAGIARQQLGAFAINVLLDDFESELARELRLDVVQIAPADLPDELFSGDFTDLVRGTEIEVGRYVQPRLFVSSQVRPSLATRPGVLVEYDAPSGFQWSTSLESRYLPVEPTLRDVPAEPITVFGAFLRREWRF